MSILKLFALASLFWGAILVSSCEEDSSIVKDPDPEVPVDSVPEPEPVYDPIPLMLKEKTYGANMTFNPDSSYTIVSKDIDPEVFTIPFEEDLPEPYTVFEFDYKTSPDVNNLQMFFLHDGELVLEHSGNYGTLPTTTEWTHLKLILKRERKDFDWGKKADNLRIDFGDNPGVTIDVRDFQMRVMTPEEEEEYEKEFANSKFGYEQLIKDYLSADYQSKVTNVSVSADKVTIRGNYTGNKEAYLVEIPPFVDMFKITDITSVFNIPLKNANFEETVDRMMVKDSYTYDRLLSRWAIFEKGNGVDKLISHARYVNPDDMAVKQTIAPITPAGKKGLGGIVIRDNNLLETDIRDLHITSATINVSPMLFMHATRQPGDLVHIYNGKEYYFNEAVVKSQLDDPLEVAAKYNVVVAGILLIHPYGTGGTDNDITKIFQHPDYQPVGIYTMPNMTTVESTDYYAAMFDFLAQRYSKPDGPRIAHWIIHNEVDGGISWTNMGNDVLLATFMETYMRSVRLCQNIVHQYDQNCRIYIPFTHSWTAIAGVGWYKTMDMLNMLNQYSAAEGDFFWAPACHSYANVFANGRIWEDDMATFSMNSPLATLKNLEILNKWVNTPANQYKGNIKRLIWLSECGTGNPINSTADNLRDQAAGFAYGWKKIKALDGIEGIQWHNWFDVAAEGSMLGLRDSQGNPKPVYDVYKNAETPNEDACFEQFLPLIGIPDWNILQEIPD